jgi:hypothetical protein
MFVARPPHDSVAAAIELEAGGRMIGRVLLPFVTVWA